MVRNSCILLLLLFFFSCGSEEEAGNSKPLRVAAASNLQFVLPVLDSLFEAETGISVDISYGASGVLTAQIRQGAPFDLFLSANEEYPAYLWDKGYALDSPQVYAQGALIWWWKGKDALEEKQTRAKKIAIGNARTAPYGVAAEEYLKRAGLWKSVKDRVVYGENIGQVNQFLLTGAADLGLTAKSVLASPQMGDSGRWQQVDPSFYKPIRQALVLTRSAQKNSQVFRDFLMSEKAKGIWRKYGYEQDQRQIDPTIRR